MSSNGDSIQNNSNEQPRASSSRYKSSSRRGRSRGTMNDRSGQPRFQQANFGDSNKKYGGGNQNEYHRGSQNEQESIDINDSSQFPSIQESSRVPIKSCSTTTPNPERSHDYGLNKPTILSNDNKEYNDFGQDSSSRRSSGSYRGYYQNQQNVNSGYNVVGGRGYFDRGNRSRGRHYFGPVRGNQYTHRGRYPRAYHFQRSEIVFPHADSYYYASPYVNANGYPCLPQLSNQCQYVEPNRLPNDPVEQVEYYFSPKNLATDHFLKSYMDKDGWVNLDVICNFKRVKCFELSVDQIASKLTRSGQLEVDMDRKKVRTRNDPHKWIVSSDQQNSSLSVNGEFQEMGLKNQEVSTFVHSTSPIDFSTSALNIDNTGAHRFSPQSIPSNFSSDFTSQNQRAVLYTTQVPFYPAYYPYPYDVPHEYSAYSLYPSPYSNIYFDNFNDYGHVQYSSDERITCDSIKVDQKSESKDFNSQDSQEKITQVEKLTQKVSNLDISDGGPVVSCE